MKFDIENWAEINLGKTKRTSTGQLNGECPWCGGDRFYLAIAGERAGMYICHQCEEKGRNPIGLIAQVEGISRGEAMRKMFREAALFRRREQKPEDLLETIVSHRGKELPEKSNVDFALPKGFVPIYSEKTGKWRFPVYLKERGVTRDTAKEWHMGYCPRGRYAGRLIIPLACPNGRSWTARDMTGKQEPRYMNPEGADHSRLLMGWDHVRLTEDSAIVEGPLDAVKAWQAGIPAYSLMGKHMSSEQAALLFRKPDDCSIVIMLDPEEAEAPYAVAAGLVGHFRNIYIARLPMGEDPGSATKAQVKAAYDDATKYRGRDNNKLLVMLGSSRQRMEKFPQ